MSNSCLRSYELFRIARNQDASLIDLVLSPNFRHTEKNFELFRLFEAVYLLSHVLQLKQISFLMNTLMASR